MYAINIDDEQFEDELELEDEEEELDDELELLDDELDEQAYV